MAGKWWQGWIPLAIGPGLIVVTWPASWPHWGLMWSLALAVYAGFKWLTWWCAKEVDASECWQLAYLLAWPGMDAQAFLGQADCARPELREWMLAASKLVVGLVFLFIVARQLPPEDPYLIGWVGMLGLILVLHFGSFHLLSCVWRSLGVDAQPLMNSPWASVSLVEFWGRRWNLAFRDLTHRFLFRPLAVRVGPRTALLLGFVASGLVHDLVISVPAGGGYGGPTLYFSIQGMALLLERSSCGRSLGLSRGWLGRLFTAALLLLPIGLLFHPPFVCEIIVSFLRAVGAL